MTRSVLQLAASAAWGGAEQMADTVRTEAERAGWRASMELPFDPGERWRDATPRDIHWWRWALSRHGDADVVHAHLPWPDRVGPVLVATRGRPLVVTFQLLPPADAWPRDRCFALPSRKLLRMAGALRRRVRWVALSQADAQTLRPLLGVEVAVVRNAPPAATTAPDPLPWPEGALRVLSVGRLDVQKGFDRMLRALAHPTLRALPWHWNILGEGSQRPALTALAASFGLSEKVSFVGARPAVDGLCRADLLLSPSRYEGMPLVPLEGAEAGVCVVASRIASHEELYARCPEALLSDDEAAWPATLARYLGDGALRTSTALAQRRLLGDNPRRVMFEAYEALYREVMAAR